MRRGRTMLGFFRRQQEKKQLKIVGEEIADYFNRGLETWFAKVEEVSLSSLEMLNIVLEGISDDPETTPRAASEKALIGAVADWRSLRPALEQRGREFLA